MKVFTELAKRFCAPAKTDAAHELESSLAVHAINVVCFNAFKEHDNDKQAVTRTKLLAAQKLLKDYQVRGDLLHLQTSTAYKSGLKLAFFR